MGTLARTAATAFIFCLINLGFASAANQLQIALPLERTAYQTNESIDLSVIRTSDQPLADGKLVLTLTGDDSSELTFTFDVEQAALNNGRASSVEHLRLNARLLRPARYAVLAQCDGAQAVSVIEVHSHIRQSSFRLVDWCTPIDQTEIYGMGEQSLGFNMILGGNNGDNTIRGGMDYMRGCTMGGGHTLDLRRECDWSDPRVVQGAAARVTAQALTDRTMPNTAGVHFYDEAGLTWTQQNGENTPHNVPVHEDVFRRTFGIDPPQHGNIDPANAADVRQWIKWGRWKELQIESAWRKSTWGVHRVRPDFKTANQGIWAWDAWTTGHYTNEIRGVDVTVGHGKYSWANVVGYYYPIMSWEFGRTRDLKQNAWHLPSWFSKTGDLYRMEQYLTFQLHATGLAKPPWYHVNRPRGIDPKDEWCSIQRLFPDITEGIVESNKRMARIGTIFTTMPVDRPKAAVLYSLANNLQHQTADMKDYNNRPYLKSLYNIYVAAKMANIGLFPVIEEDVLDGTLAANHKAVVLTGITYLEPRVISALEGFVEGGGSVILTDDCTVKIAGAQRMGVPSRFEQLADKSIAPQFQKLAQPLKEASFLVEPLRRELAKAGIQPILQSDNPEILASRQAYGDIEYVFATNATWDSGVAEPTSIKPTVATIALPADGRPVYDPILSREATEFQKNGDRIEATYRYGAGQMRVFARTARPIGSVMAFSATIQKDYLADHNPINLALSAALVDDNGKILAGSAPMQVTITDPFGTVRYDFYRATSRGMLDLALPMAANDPAGQWKATIRELLSGKTGTVSFQYQPAPQCGAIAGKIRRAIYFGNDRQKVLDFFSMYENVSIVAGTSDYSQTAATILADVLKPLDVRCSVVPLDEAAKPRPLTEEEAKTWCGLVYAGSGQIKPGDGNKPALVGFNVRGPVILIGNQNDNPLIKFCVDHQFLPYKPNAQSMPGPERGYLAWQRDAVGYGQESLTLIAYDVEGMDQAIGMLYAAASATKPLMQYDPPQTAAVAPAAGKPQTPPPAAFQWQRQLPDSIEAMAAFPGGGTVVLSKDGSLTRIQPNGSIAWEQFIDGGGQYWQLAVSDDGSTIAVGASQKIVAFDAAGKQKFSTAISKGGPKSARLACVAVSSDGSRIFASAANFLFDGFPQCGEQRPWFALRLDGNGKELWRFGDMLQPDGTKAKIYRSAAFTSDGSRIIAGNRCDYFACPAKTPSDNAADIIDAASGKVLGSIDKVNGWLGIKQVGNAFMLLDGDSTIKFVSAPEAKVLSELTFPQNGVVTAAPLGDGLIAGNEIGGNVWAVGATSGNAADSMLWQHSDPARLVKKIITNGTTAAVIYWGGTLRVFDAKGNIIAQNILPQEIMDAAWSGGSLIAADATGNVYGLSMP